MQPVGSKFPNQGSNLGPQQRKCQVLTTGSPENSTTFLFIDERTVLSPAEQISASKLANASVPLITAEEPACSPSGRSGELQLALWLAHLSRGANKGPIFASVKLGSVSVTCNHNSRLP